MTSRARVQLKTIAVRNRCTEDWGGMRGDEATRFCGKCRSNVYNLSAMSEPEVEALLARKDDVCVRYAYRPDGTIVTSACPTSSRRAPAALVAGALAYGSTFVAITTAAETHESAQSVQVAMGGLKLNHVSKHRVRVDLDEIAVDDAPGAADFTAPAVPPPAKPAWPAWFAALGAMLLWLVAFGLARRHE